MSNCTDFDYEETKTSVNIAVLKEDGTTKSYEAPANVIHDCTYASADVDAFAASKGGKYAGYSWRHVSVNA